MKRSRMEANNNRAVKAYQNSAFLSSLDARPLRILAEYLEPEARFEKLGIRDTIVFIGSARIQTRETAAAELEAAKAGNGDFAKAEMRFRMSRYYEDARQLAKRLTVWSKSLNSPERRFVVCTGGGPGIMEAANRGASEAKGLNIGLSISLPGEEPPNPYFSRQLAFEFHYFFMRKFWFAYLVKAVVVMPGGFGTLDEFFEIMTLIQTLKMKKRLPIVLFGTEFWGEVLNLEALARYGTISAGDLDYVFRTDSVDEAYEFITRQLHEQAVAHSGEAP